MGMIPGKLYATIEKRLRERDTAPAKARRALEAARERAMAISTPGTSSGGSGKKSTPGNSRVERAAVLIAMAERNVEILGKWEEVFRKIDEIFPADSTNEGFVASLMYGNGMSQEEVCRFTGCARQTIRRRRDRYVNYVALLAASEGLITREEMIDHGDTDPEDGGAPED